MTPEHQQNYESLKTELQKLTDSRIQCPGDGNLDLIVDAADVQNWKRFSTENGGNSSWYDFNHDGLTNEADLAVINRSGEHTSELQSLMRITYAVFCLKKKT